MTKISNLTFETKGLDFLFIIVYYIYEVKKMVFFLDLFGKKPEKIEFTEETCKEKVSGSDIGEVFRRCGKPLIKDLKSGKMCCSFNEQHNIKGPPEK